MATSAEQLNSIPCEIKMIEFEGKAGVSGILQSAQPIVGPRVDYGFISKTSQNIYSLSQPFQFHGRHL
jgi:hypothetical protein